MASIFDTDSIFKSGSIFDSGSIFETDAERAARLRRQGLGTSLPTVPAASDQSIFALIGGGLLSGAGAVGEFADKTLGGRAARNALEGLIGGDDYVASELLSFIPGSDMMGLTNRENIVSGQDLTEWDDPTSYMDDVVNFGVEMALDPSLVASFGTGAGVSAAGKLAKAAGVSGAQIMKTAGLKAAAEAAAQSAATGAKVAAKAPGYLRSQIGTTLDDVFRFSPELGDTIKATAARQGIDLTNDALLKSPLSGLGGLGMPFSDPSMILGTGKTGQAIAGALDTAGSAIYNAFPGKNPLPPLAALFHAPYRGAMTPPVQKIAAQGFDAEERAVYGANLVGADIHRRLDSTGWLKGPGAIDREIDLLAYIEGTPRGQGLQLPDAVREVADDVRAGYRQIQADERAAGLISPDLVDPVMIRDPATNALTPHRLSYGARLPHQFPDAPPHRFGSVRPLDTTNPFTQRREDFLRGMPEGTPLVQRMSMDPEISGRLKRDLARNGAVPQALYQEVETTIRRKYGQQFDDAGQPIPGTDQLGEYANDPSAMRQLVNFVVGLDPRHADKQIPFFAGPVQSFHGRKVASEVARSHADVAHDVIQSNAQLSDAATFDKPMRDVWHTLGKMKDHGVDPVGMGRRLELSLMHQADQAGQLAEFEALQQAALSRVDESRAIREGLERAISEKRTIPKGLVTRDWKLKRALPPELEEYVAHARDEQRLKQILSGYVMPKDLIDDATQMLAKWTVPPSVGWAEDTSRKALNLFKLFSTSLFPAFHARNYPSGQFNNAAAGAYRGVGDFVDNTRLANHIMRGTTPTGVAKHFEKLFGPGLDDKQTIDKLRDQVFAAGLLDYASHLGQADVGGAAGNRMLDLLSETNPLKPFGGFAKDPSRTWWQAINPANVRGVGTATDVNAYSRGMNQFGTYVEGQNRIAPFLGFLKQGVEPVEAARRAKAAQVDYSKFTDFEKRIATQVFPFYKFTKGMSEFVGDQLLSHPGGLMAQAVKGSGRLQRDNEYVPDSVGSQTSIPLGENDGSMRYLTGLGFAFEDPLGMVRPGVDSYDTAQNLFGGIMGKVNPYIKAPIELAAGTQFFSGRNLEDLDSNVGRIATNLGITDTPPEVPILVDQTLSNSPLARLMTTTRQASDPRKDILTRLLNFGSGVKITDVDIDRAERDAKREALERLLRSDPAIHVGQPRLFAPDEALLSPYERQLLRLLQSEYRSPSRASD